MNTIIYTRTVRNEQGTQATDVQERACRQYAEAQGWTVSKVYTDVGASGATLDRPGLQALLAAIRANVGCTLLVTSVDRLARHLHLFLMLESLFNQHRVNVIITGEHRS